jgi:predicted XRE-type DNA-binding protein
METGKRKRLEAAGWRVGDATEFLGLDEAEAELVEIKVRLAKALQEKRGKAGLTQAELAKKLGTSQPRVANMLAAREVSIDHLIRSLLLLGADAAEVARAFAGGKKTRTT